MSNSGLISNLSNSILLLSGRRAVLLSAFLGGLSALALPPFHFFPILWLTFPGLVFLLDGAVANAEKQGIARLFPAFWRGYWFGFGYFVAGLWWIGSAFLVNAEEFAALLPIAVIGLPLFLALFFGLATAIARLFWSGGAVRVLALAFGLALFEYLRGTILTGFPWNNLGSLLASNDMLMQGIAVLGVHTYGLLAVLIFASPALLLEQNADYRRAALSCFVLFAGLMVGVASYGIWRIDSHERTYVDEVSLRIIQPNIPQKEKFLPEKAGEIMNRYLELSTRSTEPGDLALLSKTHLIWPESAFPFLLTEQPDALSAIANLLPVGTTLLTGAVRADPRVPGESERTFYNSLYAVGHDGGIRDAYDKVHLVPFGEYLPFENLAERFGLLSLVNVPGGFTAGKRGRTMTIGNAPPFVPLICYEIIFPGRAEFDDDTAPPEWILNVTNDAWFGITSGPYQHFHLTRLRAVDEGLPVIRAANNGISAVINPLGQIEKSVRLGQSGIIDSQIPEKVALSFSGSTKKYLFFFILLATFLILCKARLSRSR